MATAPSNRQPRGRWLRLSLRTFFILLTIACIWLGWKAERARQQREVVELIRRSGGIVHYNYEYDKRGGWIQNSKPPVPTWVQDTLGMDLFSGVVHVDCRRRDLADVTPLARLTNLEWLILFGTQVRDVTPLTTLTNMDYLDLSKTKVQDVTPLATLTNLRFLRLCGTQVGDVRPLGNLTNLGSLDLSATQVRDVTPLAKQTNLYKLDLSSTQISDVKPLAKLFKLRVLLLDKTQVSEESYKALQQALPNCQIKWSKPKLQPEPPPAG